jgi:cytochrome c-type biogenesis protein CcmH
VFWTISAAVLLAAALITLSPLLRAKSLWRPLSLALVFLLPAASLWIYKEAGTPEAIGLGPPPAVANSTEPHTPESQEIDTMIAGLRGRLTESPDDLEGWMLLARTLKATQRYQEAVDALETANRISPDNSQVLVDLVEARIFLNADGRINDEMIAMLEQVLDREPGMQKALWLMGMAASQAGDDAFAISYWESLLEQLEPGSTIAQSVQSQIDQARGRMGMVVVEETPVAVAEDGAWPGIRLTVTGDDSGQSPIPSGGVLYVMVRSPGPAMGPPIGVRRVIDPVLPLEMTISDRDSMLKERQISSESEIQIQARISLSGSPAASSGDWQSTPLTLALDSAETVELVIDQRVE